MSETGVRGLKSGCEQKFPSLLQLLEAALLPRLTATSLQPLLPPSHLLPRLGPLGLPPTKTMVRTFWHVGPTS